MMVRYAGVSTTRLFGPYVFDRFQPATLAQEVNDTGLIQEMLTQPGVEFVVDETDPLAVWIGVDRAAECAVFEGVTTPGEYLARHGAPPGKKIFVEEVGHRNDLGDE